MRLRCEVFCDLDWLAIPFKGAISDPVGIRDERKARHAQHIAHCNRRRIRDAKHILLVNSPATEAATDLGVNGAVFCIMTNSQHAASATKYLIHSHLLNLFNLASANVIALPKIITKYHLGSPDRVAKLCCPCARALNRPLDARSYTPPPSHAHVRDAFFTHATRHC